MPYEDYATEEFVADESFQNWVYRRNESDVKFWETWIDQHPEKRHTVEQAIGMLLTLRFTEPSAPPRQVNRAWNQLQEQLSHQPPVIRRLPVFRQYRFYAATFAGILALWAGWFWFTAREVIHQTPYGAIARVTLPDGSAVVLNGNTTIRYAANWATNQPREVWLDGEAFFEVRRKPKAIAKQLPSAAFVVHSGNLRVRVLGTRFNVFNRRGDTRVVLNSGKVALATDTDRQTNLLVMQPGELAEFSEKEQKITRKSVNPDRYSAWVTHKLVFDHTPLREITQLLEETYGLTVTVDNPALLDQQVTGSMPNDNVEILLDALSRSLDLTITRNGNQLAIHTSTEN